MIQIELDDPNVEERIRAEIAAERRRRNLDAIAFARELVLRRYQLFPFVVNQIRQQESCHGGLARPRSITLRKASDKEHGNEGGNIREKKGSSSAARCESRTVC